MVSQFAAFLAAVSVVLPLLIKAAGAVGLLGSAIEAIGLFLGKFASTRVQVVGSVFVRVGKTLEAIGIDAPKVLANALSWVSKFAKLIGVGSATLALVVSVGLLGVVACTANPAPCSTQDAVIFAHGAECALRVKECGQDADCKSAVRDECNRWGDERCGFAAGGAK